MAHPKDNGNIYFDVYKSDPIDKRKNRHFSLLSDIILFGYTKNSLIQKYR